MKLRRTMLYVPGNNPNMVKDAHIYRADSVMFDLEDSVSVHEKDAARFLIFRALKCIDYENTETVVRINSLHSPYGEDDLEAMVRARPDVIRLPKTESPEDIMEADEKLGILEKKLGLPKNEIKLFAAIENARGVVNVSRITEASDRLVGVAFGAEDFVTNLHTTRSREGTELFTARQEILLAGRAAGLHVIDSVFADVNDEAGFRREVELIKGMGFDGKSVINPRQVGIVHEIYTPSIEEINHARRVIRAIEAAEEEGSGVATLNGRMVDKPVVERARRTLELAHVSGLYLDEIQEEAAHA
ncbi:MAG TPA: citrate lyase subunit beta [Sediminispirochaeta sp.]|nr:citrate lyase subunit beta [Sediminispirochaeta sp.]